MFFNIGKMCTQLHESLKYTYTGRESEGGLSRAQKQTLEGLITNIGGERETER